MITLSKNSVVSIKTLIHGYDPRGSGERICPVIRAAKAKPIVSVAERRERRAAANKDSGLSASTLNWIMDFTRTGRFRHDDTGTLTPVRRVK